MSNFKTNGEFKVMKQFLPTSTIVFDVGANQGEWIKQALHINPNIQAHCFEPCKDSYDALVKNNPNIICNHMGLSSKKQDKEIFLFNECSSYNSLYQRKGLLGIKVPTKTETIQLDTLDNYCQTHNITHIDFLKIDVEGHELEALKGSTNLLKHNKIKVIQFEYADTYIDSKVLLKDVFEFFEHFNYSLHKVYLNEITHIQHYSQKLEDFKFQNWLAISRA